MKAIVVCAIAVAGPLAALVPAGFVAGAVLCRTRTDTVKVREACKPRETDLDPVTVGLWRRAPIDASLVERTRYQVSYDSSFGSSPPCDVAGGERVTGGGCNCSQANVRRTEPSNDRWYCECDQPVSLIVTVVCTKVRVAVCGNGVREAPGEQCDGDDVSGCGPGEYTCTRSCSCRPVATTRCCDLGPGLCFDALADDAAVKCPLRRGTLAPEGQLCDGSMGRCATERRPADYCCQCGGGYSPSPPYPHPQFCTDVRENAFPAGDCDAIGCRASFGVQCGPASETCGGP